MRIQHNISALNTYRQMGTNNTGSAKSLEKLASGYKINRAGDDAAGLAISEKMRAQIKGLNRASSNAQDGISLIQAAEGALQETDSILQRMRELSVQAGNDTNEVEDRKAIQDELNQLTKEVDRIASTTEFNKKTILDGSLSSGKYVKMTSGSNLSNLNIVQPDVINGALPLTDSLNTVSVTQAGEKYDMTFDFALDNDPSNTAVINGVVQDDGMGFLNVDFSGNTDLLLAAGIDTSGTVASNGLNVTVVAGDTGATIAGKVRDILSETLGEDFTITTTGSKLNIQYKYAGDFENAIDFTSNGFQNSGSAAGDPFNPNTSATVVPGTGVQGKDMIVELNGSAFDFTSVTLNTMTGWGGSGTIGTTGDGSDGSLRGKDTAKVMFFDDSQNANGGEAMFSFVIDDATKLSTAIVGIKGGSELTLQVGANTGDSQTIGVSIQSLSAGSLGISELDVSTHLLARNAIDAVNGAIQQVSDQRAALGAVQNRLEHTTANLDTVAENLQDAESRIRDVDVAKEMMNFTKYNILQQASQAMMAQANSQPQGVLQLLR